MVEKEYNRLIDGLGVGFLRASLDGIIKRHNPAFNKIFGISESKNLIGTRFYDFWQNLKDQEEFIQILKKNGSVNNYAIPVKRVNGEEIVVLGYLNLIKNSKDTPNALEGILIDISDLYKVEKKLRESEQRYRDKLKDSEEKFRTIAEQAIMGVCIAQDNNIRYVNKVYADIFGYSIAEMMAWEIKDAIKAIHPEDRKFVLEQLNKKQKGENDTIEQYIYRGIKKSGEIIWIRIFSKTINYLGHSADLITIVDITKEQKAEKIIRDENKGLKELDKTRKDFLDITAHELKNPLTAILGAIQLLCDLKNDELSAESLELLKIAKNGSERLKNIVENFLDLSRLESNKFEIIKKRLDLVEIVNNCVEDMIYLSKKRKHTIKISLPKEFYINGDEYRIKRVIINILSNALKYTPLNGQINIDLERINNSAKLSIRDSGIGLKKKEINELFKKFSKIDRSSEELDLNMEGTGLGLYISKEIINLHNGEIWAESKGRNKGSKFIIKLPLS